MGLVLFRLIMLVFGTLSLMLHWGLIYLVVAVLLASGFNFLYSFSIVIFAQRLVVWRFRWDRRMVRYLFKLVAPFFGITLFIKVYASLDAVMLSLLAGDAAVGYFAVPQRIVFVLPFVAGAFIAAVYPAMSNYFVTSPERLIRLFEKTFRYLMILSVPAALGVFVLSKPIILDIWPEFAPSILALQIMSFAVVFLFLEYPCGSLLNAAGREKINMLNRGIHVTAAIILNLVLIPLYGFIGAAISAVAVNVLLVGLGLYQTGKVIRYSGSFLLVSFLKIFLSHLPR